MSSLPGPRQPGELVAFRFPAVTTLFVASFALSIASDFLGRRLRRALRAP